MRVIAAILLAACGSAAPPTAALPPLATPPAPPAPGEFRYMIGGDSRDDRSHVVPWAFHEAKARGAVAFMFLGDLELTPSLEPRFLRELAELDPIPFYPTLGNHEIKRFGLFSIDRSEVERKFRGRFLGTPRTPIASSIDDKVVYSVELPGGVHFIALDNVSQKGFGASQLAWLAADLDRATADTGVRYIIVGMHKPLAHNGVTRHSMDRDGTQAIADSEAALALFQQHHVAAIFASHDHRYASFAQGGIPSYITGGLGAPLDRKAGPDSFHHVLELDLTARGLAVHVLRFDGAASVGEEPEDE